MNTIFATGFNGYLVSEMRSSMSTIVGNDQPLVLPLSLHQHIPEGSWQAGLHAFIMVRLIILTFLKTTSVHFLGVFQSSRVYELSHMVRALNTALVFSIVMKMYPYSLIAALALPKPVFQTI